MALITAIAAHPRREGRYRIEVDHETVAIVDANTVLEAELRVGLKYDSELAAQIKGAFARLLAFDHGLAALARRGRSVRELERWLRARKHGSKEVRQAVERLGELGFLDDAEFARAFARSRAIGRGLSRRRIQAELVRRGVEGDLIEAAISGLMQDEQLDESVLINAAATKKLGSLASHEPEVQRRRLYGYLSRRGFPLALVRETVARLMKGSTSD